jgi:hypothetical protein
MRRRPKPLPCRSVILNEDQRRLGPLKRASRVKSDTRAQALRPAAWWNGRHSRLKICFWETGVPVRVRPRPPSAFRRRRASSFHWPDRREADACSIDKLARHKPRHPRHVEFGILASARQDITGVDSPRCSRSRKPSLETDSVGKSHRAPTPGPDTFVAWHSCSCR